MPRLFYDKLPEDISSRYCLLLDPMFATGGSATMAVEVLISRGVPEERILFLNLIASPQGIQGFAERFPKLRIITAFVDQGLDGKKWVYLLFLLWVVVGGGGWCWVIWYAVLTDGCDVVILSPGWVTLVTGTTASKRSMVVGYRSRPFPLFLLSFSFLHVAIAQLRYH